MAEHAIYANMFWYDK